MTNYTLLSDPQEVIGKQWSEDQSPEQERILALARDALCFVGATGQRYRFEEFRESIESGTRPPAGAIPASAGVSERSRAGCPSLEERLHETEAFFTKLRDETHAAGEKELIQVILDALHFIASTRQHGAFDEYLEHVEADAPPYVMASFVTKEEAETWLRNHPHPPDSADVLVANVYHDVIHELEPDRRRLPRNRHLEHYLADLQQEKPPNPVASFASLEEAEAWLKAQPKPARWAWVSIAGEPYLAAYYPNIDHRALYPLSMARGYEEPSG
jgi:hypothetical protein